MLLNKSANSLPQADKTHEGSSEFECFEWHLELIVKLLQSGQDESALRMAEFRSKGRTVGFFRRAEHSFVVVLNLAPDSQAAVFVLEE